MIENFKISVIGSGTMGNGIAHVFAQSGFKTLLIARLKSFFLPPHLEENIPGWLSKISTSSPESSERHGSFRSLEKYLALITEFSWKDFPVSGGLLIL